jgi:hypothetical protein
MASRLSPLAGAGLAALLAALIVLAQPAPPPARANIACEVGSAPAHAITGGLGAITGGAIGGGNPVGDACNSVTDGVVGAATAPIKEAVSEIGNGIFNQITSWVTQGASWLIGKVVVAIDATTTPQLNGKGFVAQYRQMAEIAAFLAAGMLLFAVLEGLAQGSAAMLARVVLVNVPLAFLATGVAFLVAQLLLSATDGLSHAVAASTNRNAAHFFAGAIHGLSKAGGSAGAAAGTATGGPGVGTAVGGAAGAAGVPLFVTFLAAAIAAFAAFFVWIELLMRDAAVYVVALFMPLALAAAIWPRWSGALRRTGELLVVVIASKFVIVAIISLAAGLLANNAGQVEQILAAAALMLLACFSPFVLFRLVPFAEGAMAAAYGRRSAASGAVSGVHLYNSAQMVRNTSRRNWRGGSADGAGSGGAPGPEAGGGSPGGAPKPPGGSGGGGAAGGGLAVIAGGAQLASAAARGSRGAAERLAATGTAQMAGEAGAEPAARPSERQSPAVRRSDEELAPEPSRNSAPRPSQAAGSAAPRPAEQTPRPPAAPPASGGGSGAGGGGGGGAAGGAGGGAGG